MQFYSAPLLVDLEKHPKTASLVLPSMVMGQNYGLVQFYSAPP